MITVSQREEFEEEFPPPEGIYWSSEIESYVYDPASGDTTQFVDCLMQRSAWRAWVAAQERLTEDMEEEDLAFMVGADCGPGMLLAMRDKAIAELRSYIKDLEDGNEKR